MKYNSDIVDINDGTWKPMFEDDDVLINTTDIKSTVKLMVPEDNPQYVKNNYMWSINLPLYHIFQTDIWYNRFGKKYKKVMEFLKTEFDLETIFLDEKGMCFIAPIPVLRNAANNKNKKVFLTSTELDLGLAIHGIKTHLNKQFIVNPCFSFPAVKYTVLKNQNLNDSFVTNVINSVMDSNDFLMFIDPLIMNKDNNDKVMTMHIYCEKQSKLDKEIDSLFKSNEIKYCKTELKVCKEDIFASVEVTDLFK